MKKAIIFCTLIFSITGLQAHEALDFAGDKFASDTFKSNPSEALKEFASALENAEKYKNEFSFAEQERFEKLTREAIKMIDGTINNKTPTRSNSAINDEFNFHLNEAQKAENRKDSDKFIEHFNKATHLLDQLPNQELLKSREDNFEESMQSQNNEFKKQRSKFDHKDWDFAELGK